MNGIDDIYTDLIMDHCMNSCNKHCLACATCTAMGHNPNCGDEIKLEFELDGDIIKDMSFTGHGCAISQSSTSIMIDTLRGKTIEQAKKIVGIFIKMIDRKPVTDEEKELLGDSIAFENISNMPARVKCALLAWHTTEDVLNSKTQNACNSCDKDTCPNKAESN